MTGDVTKLIETRSGQLRVTVEDDLVVARGVRFAEAPVGDLRFRRPVPAPAWTGTRDAFEYGAVCPQNPAMLSAPGERQDEDCLFLNVWTPDVDPSAPLPVMVWIHGGGFTTGSGSTPWYDGAALARRGVVVVTINYRLGALGQVHLAVLDGVDERLSECADLGMLDQVVALEWVRDNVASFGGDPGSVTVFGESAGAMSIGVLMGMPSANGLFHRAILQSGASRNVSSPEHATSIARALLDALDATPSQVVDAPVEALLAAQTAVTERIGAGVLPFQPVVDGDIVPRPPLDVMAAGALAGIDVIVGTTSDEAKLFTAFVPKLFDAGESDVARRIERSLGHDPTELVATYRRRLGDAPPRREIFDAAFTDWVFRVPAIELAELGVASGSSVWMYEFAERGDSFEGLLGACHAIDVPFVWDNLSARGVSMILGERTHARRELASLVADAWVRFATTGNPNPAGPEAWPRYDIPRRATRRFAADSVVTVDDPNGDERRLWPVRSPEPR